MANLNIPFLLLQPSLCQFKPTLAASKLIPYAKYNFKPIPAGSNRSLHTNGIKKSGSGINLPQGKLY